LEPVSDAVYRAPKGTQDVLPPQSARWERFVASFAGQAHRAGYGLHIPPMFEHYEVFARVGESTDIVRKEMYDFDDRGGRHIALRPEGTASVARAFVEHRPTTPFKAWYVAPSFRNEAPQAGRYRQHHQVGIEVLGTDDPDVDVEVIALLDTFYRSLGLRQVSLQLNSLGDAACRPSYLAALRAYLESRAGELTEQSRQTLAVNPLRVLDSKRPEDAAIIADAPRMVDHLCAECASHFARVQTGLQSLGMTFELAPRLVRGLDYYTRTTFEFAADALDNAQNAVGGGGRYDGLVEQMGGPPTPGIGFGAGIERTLLACDAEGVFPVPTAVVDVFVVDTTGGDHALALSHELRAAGLRADRGFDQRSMKSQMKQADRTGAAVALIIGEQEAADGNVTVRDLRNSEQEVVSRADVVDRVGKMLRS
jgi:histidyl-tRNA synthetase